MLPSATDAAPSPIENLLVQGMRLQRIGRSAEAEALFRYVLGERPESIASACLASVLHDRAAYPIALEHYARALALRPEAAALHGDRGIAFRAQGNAAGAIASAERALDFDPTNARLLSNLGIALRDGGKLAEAEAALDRALGQDPELVEGWDNRGTVRLQRGALDAAVADLGEAVARAPARAASWYNLGNAWKKAGRLAEAIGCFRRACALQPGLLAGHHNLGNALQDMGDLDLALASYRQARLLDPDFAVAHSNLVFARLYDHRDDGRALVEAHAAWGACHAPTARPVPIAVRRARPRLRVGYVSPDLCRHSVCYFAEPVLESHDHDRVEIYCYAEVSAPDDVTQRFRRCATVWRSTVGLDDDAVADLVRADEVDVLVDLAGHTAGNRLQVFARRAAPLQLAWLGYPFSTGLSTIDALIGDAVLTPDGMPALERIERLDRPWVCYRAPDYAPAVAPVPATRPGHVTFGSFSNLAKLNADVVATWAAILGRLPNARLLLNNRWLADAATRDRLARLFKEQGVEPHRLDFLATAPHDVTLAQYGRVDIALDPFPFNGLTVTCEALWAGVPVVTLAAADRPVGRMGAALLSALGVKRLTAQTRRDYVEAAVALAHDIDALKQLRATLRADMAASPLGDGPGLARALETAYLRMARPESRLDDHRR
ncbi:MAG: tetratricopeptide repeat protein [Alphaproteobacteria bacterium]|nr:tetratricopeptide repeat protein [Alphaproteobacteria bacterium]